MRLVVWNCQDKFDRNVHHLNELQFDIAVVSECGPFEASLLGREVTSKLERPIKKPGHRKQIGVLAAHPWRVEALPMFPDQPWVLPVRIRGPVDFTVLAVWALTPKCLSGQESYAAQTGRVVSEILSSLDGPVVLAGDLNAPIDGSLAAVRRHADNVAKLELAGLVSAFTATRGPDRDPLTEPTLFFQRKEDRPFHIDHAFVPTGWTEGMTMSIGSHRDWVATGRSDHVPLVIDVEPGAIVQSCENPPFECREGGFLQV